MHITFWTYVPPAIGAIVITALGISLRRLLRVPANPAALANEAETAKTTTGQSPSEREWSTIVRYWGEEVTGPLTALIGAVVLVTTLWVLAYIGWTVLYFGGGLSTPPALPPWFGNPLNVLGFAFTGAGILVAGFLTLGLLLGAAWFVGRCLLWPKACSVCSDDSTEEADRR